MFRVSSAHLQEDTVVHMQQDCYNISSMRKISGQATFCPMDVAFRIIKTFAL